MFLAWLKTESFFPGAALLFRCKYIPGLQSDFFLDKLGTMNYTYSSLLNRINKYNTKMLASNIHDELKVALQLYKYTLKDWAATLKKPDGSVGVSSTAVILNSQGREETPWIRSEIENLISKAQTTFPDFYDFHYKKAASE